MADNYLITGYHGEPHVTAENDRSLNAAMYGVKKVVLPVGEQFRAEYIGNNTIRMYDGKLMDHGAAAGIPHGEYVDLVISNAAQTMKRKDLIVFEYSRDSSTLIERGEFKVIQGTESSGTAVRPTITEGSLLSSLTALDQMALWEVDVSGATISAPTRVFEMAPGMGDSVVDNVITSDSEHPVTSAAIHSALASHKHAASAITAGTLGGQVKANATAVTALGTEQVRNIIISTEDLVAGESELATGTVYLVYE